MPRRTSKEKQINREDYPRKEQFKAESGMFDERTVKYLGYLMTHGIVSELSFQIARGKEADIYVAMPGTHVHDDVVVVKIFRIETSHFMKRIDYIYGDPRFSKIKRNIHSVVSEWCKKEYGNLKLAADAKVHAPLPYYFDGNVLAMQFIGVDGVPAQNLKAGGTDSPEKTLDSVIEDLRRLYQKAGLVHADVSEYNILMKGDTPYLIDFGQAVVLGHPKAQQFLERDVRNLLTFFQKEYGVKRDSKKVLAHITEQ